MSDPTCVLPDCDKPSRNPRSPALCPMHYHRQYRHGRTDATAARVSTSSGRNYQGEYRKGHPIADKTGKGWTHRFVLYDAIGPGPHPCHHCGTPVDWRHPERAKQLEADHLNHDGADNRPENLVPSCRSCNQRRAGTRRHRALKDAGWWSGNDTVAALLRHQRRPLD